MDIHKYNPIHEGIIPLGKRLAFRQAKYVVLIALCLGLFSGGVEIYLGLLEERAQLETTLKNLSQTIRYPAAKAAQLADRELAQYVVENLKDHPFVHKIRLLDEANISLIDWQLPPKTKFYATLIYALFGEPRVLTQELYTSDILTSNLHSLLLNPYQRQVGLLVIEIDPYVLGERFIHRAHVFLTSELTRSLLFGVLLFWLFHRSITYPLARMSGALAKMDLENPQCARLPKLPAHQDDEFGYLITVTNRLLENIEGHINQQAEIEDKLLKLSHAVEHSPILIVITSIEGLIEYVSPSVVRLSEYSETELIGATPRIFKSTFTSKQRYVEMWDTLLSGKEWRGQFLNCKKGGGFYWVNAFISSVQNKEGQITHFLAVEEDITELKVREKQFEDLIYYDTLTQLPNRTLFDDRLQTALAQLGESGEFGAVMLLDIDRFKTINDSLGYSAGDKLLQEIATRLASQISRKDTLARISGDKFAVLLTQLDSIDRVAKMAEMVVRCFAEPFNYHQQEFFFTISLGISLFPSDGQDTDTLLSNAETAMYRVKNKERNSYQFYKPAMNVQAAELLALENNLRRVISDVEQMNQQFKVYYQPQIDLHSGKLCGVEALIRWQHPQRGLVSPRDFIPLAEETGLIVPIGEWVLRVACEQANQWFKQGAPRIRVAVNISAQQFQTPHFVSFVQNILHSTGLPPECLDLEITESTLMGNVQTAQQVLAKLKTLGLRVSIDDFGTGYSSLNYLRKFPVDTLKIDQSFISDLNLDEDNTTITKVIIDMSHNLNLSVIAEGVETEGQLNFLRHHLCDEIQGFYISMPLPYQEFTKLLLQEHFSIAPYAPA
ncbi:MAG: EAL domain-containing protein [Thiotrichaceae bacterium]|nr:EAL domain-containing protein [Thiotrichaceae bacterium]